MKPEARFRTRVEDKLPHKVHAQGMALMHSNGTPDRYYEGPNGNLFVEYKWIAAKKPRFVLPDLSPLQRAWVNRRYDNKHPVAVIVGCPTGGVVYLNRMWDHEITGTEFLAQVIPVTQIARWIQAVTMESSINALRSIHTIPRS